MEGQDVEQLFELQVVHKAHEIEDFPVVSGLEQNLRYLVAELDEVSMVEEIPDLELGAVFNEVIQNFEENHQRLPWNLVVRLQEEIAYVFQSFRVHEPGKVRKL